MRLTIDIPDDIAGRMLSGSDETVELFEFAGYTACVMGRISEYEYMQLLGLESRFDLHAVLKRIQLQIEAFDTASLSFEAVIDSHDPPLRSGKA